MNTKLSTVSDKRMDLTYSACGHEFSYRIGVWVGTQRSKSDVMSLERKQRLDDNGFVWDASKDKT
jgi:hypothetical protein